MSNGTCPIHGFSSQGKTTLKESVMSVQKCIRGGVLAAMIISLLFTVSCAKKSPKTDLSAEEQAHAAEMAGQKTTADQAAIGEEDLAARQRSQEAQQMAKQQAEEARKQFVNERVYFDFNDASLQPDALKVMAEKAKWMIANPDASILIAGNCDERGTDEYNLALGARRADSAKDYLVKAGVEASRIKTISYGKERPLDPAHNDAAWAKNRRDDFTIIP